MLTKLTSEEVKKVFEIFTLYTNGYIPRMDDAESGYMSPACDWNNFGTIRYDEMTALQLAKKIIPYDWKSEIWKGLERHECKPCRMAKSCTESRLVKKRTDRISQLEYGEIL